MQRIISNKLPYISTPRHAKDLKIAPLNVCSIRKKIDELRVLQSICAFDIIAITETHLDGSTSDNFLYIDGMKLFRRDRTKCKGGGCIMYCAEYCRRPIAEIWPLRILR